MNLFAGLIIVVALLSSNENKTTSHQIDGNALLIQSTKPIQIDSEPYRVKIHIKDSLELIDKQATAMKEAKRVVKLNATSKVKMMDKECNCEVIVTKKNHKKKGIFRKIVAIFHKN